MIVTCPACSARFNVSESALQDRSAVVACPRCNGRITVRGGLSPAQVAVVDPGEAKRGPTTVAGSPLPDNMATRDFSIVGVTWRIERGGGLSVYEVHRLETLHRYLQTGQVTPADRISCDGTTWVALGAIHDLEAFFWLVWQQALQGDGEPTTPVPGPRAHEALEEEEDTSDGPTALVGRFRSGDPRREHEVTESGAAPPSPSAGASNTILPVSDEEKRVEAPSRDVIEDGMFSFDLLGDQITETAGRPSPPLERVEATSSSTENVDSMGVRRRARSGLISTLGASSGPVVLPSVAKQSQGRQTASPGGAGPRTAVRVFGVADPDAVPEDAKDPPRVHVTSGFMAPAYRLGGDAASIDMLDSQITVVPVPGSGETTSDADTAHEEPPPAPAYVWVPSPQAADAAPSRSDWSSQGAARPAKQVRVPPPIPAAAPKAPPSPPMPPPPARAPMHEVPYIGLDAGSGVRSAKAPRPRGRRRSPVSLTILVVAGLIGLLIGAGGMGLVALWMLPAVDAGNDLRPTGPVEEPPLPEPVVDPETGAPQAVESHRIPISDRLPSPPSPRSRRPSRAKRHPRSAQLPDAPQLPDASRLPDASVVPDASRSPDASASQLSGASPAEPSIDSPEPAPGGIPEDLLLPPPVDPSSEPLPGRDVPGLPPDMLEPPGAGTPPTPDEEPPLEPLPLAPRFAEPPAAAPEPSPALDRPPGED